MAWLNPKGVRELALKNALAKWWPHIGPGMRRRTAVSILRWCSELSADCEGLPGPDFEGDRTLSTAECAHETHRL